MTESLPLELLRPILSHLQYRFKDLAACAQVSHIFYQAATPYLYQRLFLLDQQRLQLVFATLSQNPHLCQLVTILELRVFPFGLNAERLEQLEAQIEVALNNALNLQQLVWTRTGSLNDRLLPHLLRSSTHLKRLEITGDARTWTTRALLQHIQPGIEHLSIILPERSVVNALVDITAKLRGQDDPDSGLKSLSLLCQHSPLLTDAHLMAMAPNLPNLQRLSLAGCRAVTGQGISTLLKAASCRLDDSQEPTGLRELALEGLNIQPSDLLLLKRQVNALRILSITYPRSSSSSASSALLPEMVLEFYHNFCLLLDQAASLEELTHYAGAGTKSVLGGDTDDSDDNEEEQEDEMSTQATVHSQGQIRSLPPPNLPLLPSSLVHCIVSTRGAHLRKLRLHGIGISLDQLAILADGCPQLEDLVIQIWEDDLPRLIELLTMLPKLESLHLLASSSSDTALAERDIQSIAQACADANGKRRAAFNDLLFRASAQGLDLQDCYRTERPQRIMEDPGLRQIGFRNRVWLIERNVMADSRQDVSDTPETWSRRESNWRFDISLKLWDPAAGMFPEVLLVVKS